MTPQIILYIVLGILGTIAYFFWLRNAMINAQQCDCEGECKTVELCEKFMPKKI